MSDKQENLTWFERYMASRKEVEELKKALEKIAQMEELPIKYSTKIARKALAQLREKKG